MPRRPRSDALFTARSRTVLCTVPFTTRWTLPVAFSSTNMSLGPMNAMLIGWSRPETAVRTARSGSTTLGAASARPGRTSTAARASGSASTRNALVIIPPQVVDQTPLGVRGRHGGGLAGSGAAEKADDEVEPATSAWDAAYGLPLINSTSRKATAITRGTRQRKRSATLSVSDDRHQRSDSARKAADKADRCSSRHDGCGEYEREEGGGEPYCPPAEMCCRQEGNPRPVLGRRRVVLNSNAHPCFLLSTSSFTPHGSGRIGDSSCCRPYSEEGAIGVSTDDRTLSGREHRNDKGGCYVNRVARAFHRRSEADVDGRS